ncbi:MAG: DUF4893 domain-containing protein [Pseudomonadota bacterium]
MIAQRLVALAAVAAVAALAACSPREEKATATGRSGEPAPSIETAPSAPATAEPAGAAGWKAVAAAADQDRIARLPAAWREALAEADDLHGAEIDSTGLLLVPDAALEGNLRPAPGRYRCRTIKIGSPDGTGLSYVAYPWFTCTIEPAPGGELILTKTSGSQRTRGLLYPDGDRRLVFVGTQAWGADETAFPAYGEKPERDQVGVFERVGTDRWRLALPWPKQESKLDVIELRK